MPPRKPRELNHRDVLVGARDLLERQAGYDALGAVNAMSVGQCLDVTRTAVETLHREAVRLGSAGVLDYESMHERGKVIDLFDRALERTAA